MLELLLDGGGVGFALESRGRILMVEVDSTELNVCYLSDVPVDRSDLPCPS